MHLTVQDFLQMDLPAMLAGLFATLACSLLGTFLVLRRQSLMGDALSHSVLPGIIIGFLIAGSRETMPIFLGALGAAVTAAVLIELVRRFGRVEAGTAMGVVFSIMFAAGVVLIEQAHARMVDLDADCVLYGQMEDILWLSATGWGSLADPSALSDLPRQVVTLAVVLAVTLAAILVFYKELKISSFDPALATTLGINAALVQFGLIVLVGAVAVAAFEAVGSILVVAMFICPAAAARMFTDRLAHQLALSAAFAALASLGGYVLGAFGPFWLGADYSLRASGMIAVAAGMILAVAILFAPRYGILGRRLRHPSVTAAG